MKKKHILILILMLLSVFPYSCSPRYYSEHRGKVTKGYNKPPKKWKQPKSKYPEVRDSRREQGPGVRTKDKS